MKTISTIRTLIETEENFAKKNKELQNTRLVNSSKKKLLFYRGILLYLETSPKETFLVSEKERLKRIIENKELQFDKWLSNCQDKNLKQSQYRTLFNKEVGLDVLKRQFKAIKFLCDD